MSGISNLKIFESIEILTICLFSQRNVAPCSTLRRVPGFPHNPPESNHIVTNQAFWFPVSPISKATNHISHDAVVFSLRRCLFLLHHRSRRCSSCRVASDGVFHDVFGRPIPSLEAAELRRPPPIRSQTPDPEIVVRWVYRRRRRPI